MADLESIIERQKGEIDVEIEKLRPQAEEYERLVAYRSGMDGATPRARRSTRARSGGSSTGGASRSDANRPEQFMKAVNAAPGASIPEIAKWINDQDDNDTDVSANYLYRVREALEKDGHVRREGNKHYLTDSGAKEIGVTVPKAA